MIGFVLLALAALALAIISCLPEAAGLYTSPPMLVLWGAMAVFSLRYIIHKRLFKRPSVFLVHIAFIVILIGGALTHFCSIEERIHLRQNESMNFAGYSITLTKFDIIYYPGTKTPADYISTLEIDGDTASVSMNKTVVNGPLRFFQTAYDPDCLGSIITVSQDASGTTVTYVGYALLAMGMILCAFPRRLRNMFFFCPYLCCPWELRLLQKVCQKILQKILGSYIFTMEGE